jgi:hypothetical protein
LLSPGAAPIARAACAHRCVNATSDDVESAVAITGIMKRGKMEATTRIELVYTVLQTVA